MQAQGAYPFFKTLPASLALTDVNVQELDAIQRESMLRSVGYPNGLFDSKHFPRLSCGQELRRLLCLSTTAASRYFLVDASVFPGSSGSPVLLIQKTGYVTRNGGSGLRLPASLSSSRRRRISASGPLFFRRRRQGAPPS